MFTRVHTHSHHTIRAHSRMNLRADIHFDCVDLVVDIPIESINLENRFLIDLLVTDFHGNNKG